jgi:hypothetical protein
MVQKYPDQPAKPVCNCADGLCRSKPLRQATIDNFEDASFDLYRGVDSLIENACKTLGVWRRWEHKPT